MNTIVESPLLGLSLRQPPSNLQAEQSLLGALLANNRAIEQCAGLRPEMFADSVNGLIFSAIHRRIESGRLANAVSLAAEFERSGVLEEAGGTAYLAQLIASMVGIINAREYAALIRECAARREFIEIGERLVNGAYESDALLEMGTAAAGRIDAIAMGGPDASGVMLDAAIDDAMVAIEEARTRQGPSGISTGFRAIDNRIGGLEPGTLTVIAGRPGMGKSVLGLMWALAAARTGVPVLLISLEMSSRELGRRVLATAAEVPVTAMKYGRINADQASRLVVARRELRGLPLKIDDAAGLTAAQIAGRARSLKRKGLGLVVIDHLHIVRPDDLDSKQGATWAVGRISGALKRLAKDCGVPVLLLAQLNRGVEGRDDKRPGLGDLRQAGDIEQDADAVGFVYRPECYLGAEPEAREGEARAKLDERRNVWRDRKADVAGKAELIWAKIRDGETGTDPLLFDGPTTTFREPSND